MARYGKSPYIYPLYGLGELPQSFARLSAIYGGTYMLDKTIDEIITDSDGKFVGVKSGDEVVKAKQVIGDPSYFGAGKDAADGKMRVVEEGKVVRAICILKHPIPQTDNSDSCQIIIPQNQVGRRNGERMPQLTSWIRSDKFPQIFISPWFLRPTMCVQRTSTLPLSAQLWRLPLLNSKSDQVLSSLAPFTTSTCLSHTISDHRLPCFRFVSVTPLYTPTSTGESDSIFVTRSYDATSHFETVVDDVHDVFKRVTGKDLILKKREVEVQE
jgi:Rab GDP dissociation inhibitor